MSYAVLGDSSSSSKSVSIPSASADDDDNDALLHRSHSSRDTAERRSALSEPLTAENGMDDPFYVFREDLHRKLNHVDECLAEYLRIIHQTVRATTTWKPFLTLRFPLFGTIWLTTKVAVSFDLISHPLSLYCHCLFLKFRWDDRTHRSIHMNSKNKRNN